MRWDGYLNANASDFHAFGVSIQHYDARNELSFCPQQEVQRLREKEMDARDAERANECVHKRLPFQRGACRVNRREQCLRLKLI